MAAALLGRKIGMTRLFDEAGSQVPVTVIQAGPCYVSQIKTVERDGYDALQLAFEDVKGRNSTMPVIGHDAAAGVGPQRFHREFGLRNGRAGIHFDDAKHLHSFCAFYGFANYSCTGR